MIDPLLSLAISLHSNKGVYALLIGSGVSTSAGIPTGWEIVLDLVEKVAHLKNENCSPDPETWYKQKFEHDPRYDELVNDVAKSPAERRNFLRSYFEPTADEREQGKKVPQGAHRAIAELIARGYIRVIITTNFDRLLERALEDQGIHPTVIATADAVKGALPIVQTACTLIKVNGDYLDARIRNTPEELARYDRVTNKLLDQVFDEFGLIVCGWSAEWDAALCQAIRRCPARRFTAYWTLKREPKPITRDLIEFRHAHSIQITGADEFFRDLAEKVFSLDTLAEQHPLSAKVAAEQVKRYIADDRHRILLHDFVGRETDTLYHRLSEDSFSWAIQLSEDGFRNRVKKYEALTESMIAVMATGCYWGEQTHEGLWPGALERIAVPPFTWQGGDTSFPRLAFYPALLMLYSGGITALAAKKYATFAALLRSTRCRLLRDDLPMVLGVNTWDVMERRSKWLPGKGKHHTPLSDNLFELLRDPLHEYLPDDLRYEEAFDEFEYILSLICFHFSDVVYGRDWLPFGRFTWNYKREGRNSPMNSPMNKVQAETEEVGLEWPLLKFGLFNGALERFQEIKQRADQLIREKSGRLI